MQMANEKFFLTLVGVVLLALLPSVVMADMEEARSGASASDPTAAVEFPGYAISVL